MDKSERYIERFSEAEDTLLTELDRATNLHVVQPKMVSGRVQGTFLKLVARMLRPRCVLEIGTFTGYSALSIAAGLDDGARLHTVEIDDELEDIARSFFERSPHGSKIRLHIGSALEVVPELVKELRQAPELVQGLRQAPSGDFTGSDGDFAGFDMVFIDGDKREYPAYYKMLMGDGAGGSPMGDAGGEPTRNAGEPMVHSGSIILADNVLWYGKVAEAVGKEDGGGGKADGQAAGGNETDRQTANSGRTDRQTASGGKADRQTAGIVEFNRLVAADPRVENVILPLRDGINLIRVK